MRRIGDDTNALGMMHMTNLLGLKLRLRSRLKVEVRNNKKACCT